jgi:hypothetical protein
MPTLTLPASPVHSTRPVALDWPDWNDDDRWSTGPDPADAQHWADQNADWHFDGPTPDEVLDAPEPRDWDAEAAESEAIERLCAGCLL